MVDLAREREGKEVVGKDMAVVGMVRVERGKEGVETELVGLDLAGGGCWGATQP